MLEIENLHKEWFPLDYPKKFYETVLQKERVIAIGCFIENPYGSHEVVSLQEGDEEQKEKEDHQPKEIMLGSIISRIKIGKDDVIDIHLHNEDEEFKRQTSAAYYWAS
mmetsp:Transcript_34081/g.52360  ORF Transcript_34081/g.52360 Transcript_34081/m.52360 type:complete len:108 (-) Transcript_34081:309-632(-)